MYVVEIVLDDGAPALKQETSEAATALALVTAAVDHLRFLVVADIRDRVDWGNFLVWLRDGRAYVRQDEHRDHYATDPRAPGDANSVVTFMDEDGSTFEVPARETVSRSQALRALEFWLSTGERLPELSWS